MAQFHKNRTVGSLVLSGCLLCIALLLLTWETIPGIQQRQLVSRQTAAAEPPVKREKSEDEVTARLNYYGTNWSRVFNDLAEAHGLTLVAEKVPSGRYARRDRAEYSLSESLKILNNELAEEGFRLIRKGEFLIVMELSQLRPRYPRPVVSKSAGSSSNRFESNRPASDTSQKELQAAKRRQEFFNKRRAEHQNKISLVEHEELAKPVSQEKLQQQSIALRHRTASEISRMIYRVFRSRANLLDRGPKNLPAFVVYTNPPASEKKQSSKKAAALSKVLNERRVQFSIGIDTKGNQLVVEAGPRQLQVVTELIHKLDIPAISADETLKLISTKNESGQIAKNLQPALTRLIAQRKLQSDLKDSTAGADDKKKTPPIPVEKPKGKQPKVDLPGIVGNLRGDVTVESLDDLGILILRGNQVDVDAVMTVIRQIEQLTVGTVPEIHLRMLVHVNGEALAELLTNVYEELGNVRANSPQQVKPVSIIPVVKPNSILLIAPATEMESILDLIDKLDQPVDPRTEFSVFHLENAIAAQVVEMIDNFYDERAGLGPRVTAIADVRTNSIVVQADPADMTEIAALIKKIDRDHSGAVATLKIFPLKNAVAEELAELINEAIQSVINPPATTGQVGGGQIGAGGQSSQQLRDVKSAVLQFLAVTGKNQRMVRSGILADIRVTADPRTNSLLVTAPKQSMELLTVLIQNMDAPTDQVAEIKVFGLEYSDATTTAELLTDMFDSQNQQGQQGVLGIQLAGAQDASSNLIPIRFSVDVRSNSIIAIGGVDALSVVEAVLLRLDQSDIRERKSTVIRLKNSFAPDVADSLTTFRNSLRELETADPDLISSVELLEREIVFVADEATNNLMISATPKYFDEVIELVLKLDEAPQQVIIQALLVEVTLDNLDEFGVELGIQDSLLFNRSLLEILETTDTTTTDPNGVQTTTTNVLSTTATPGFLFNSTQTLGNNVAANSTKTAGQGISNFSLGRANADLGFGGLVLSAGSESVNILLRALAQTRQLDVLSRPQIRTLDNQLAEIQVGQEVPVVDGATITNNVTSPTIRRDEAGILLSVTPRISPDGQIVMEVIAEKSQFTGAGVPVLIDAVTGNVIESPIKDISVVRTTVSVTNNQTIVLGGMITKTDQTITRKVPWLGDIPYLGIPFRFDSVTSKRTELLIFLTPRIIRNDEESEMIKQIEAKRLHFMEDAAEEMHGPLYAVPAENEMTFDDDNSDFDPDTAPPADDLNTPTSVIPGDNPGLLQIPGDTFDEQTLFSDDAELSDRPFKLQQASFVETEKQPAKKRSFFGIRSLFHPLAQPEKSRREK